MLTTIRQTAFKRDYKRCKKQGKNFHRLVEILDYLIQEQVLPETLRDHALTGN